MTIWSSASCSLTILLNSVGLPAFPPLSRGQALANNLGCRSKQAGLGVSPTKTRVLVWRMTCCTRGTMFTSSRRNPSSTACREPSARLTPSSIFLAKRLACPTTPVPAVAAALSQ
jgi:hypothetical protein